MPSKARFLPAVRVMVASFLCVIAGLFAASGLFQHYPTSSRGRLANFRTEFPRVDLLAVREARFGAKHKAPLSPAVFSANTPTFGNPVISGIGGVGFEQSIRIDPNPINAQSPIHRIYTSAPGTLSADTSWVWNSLDGGKTFKWVIGAAPFEGKVTTCHGGGDSEIAVDSASHLYFNDLTLPNFSTSRSDDFGATFRCSNTGVPDAVVDRQWYAVDGDPTNGGTIYLANDEIGPGGVNCSPNPATIAGNNVLVMYRSPVDPLLAQTTAGIEFGPPNRITGVGTCDEAIMGNVEISDMATPTGLPNGSLPVKHIYVVHDNVALNKISIGRCFPVAFGAPIPGVSDPSGLNCTDLLVRDLGPNARTGANFPTLAIDKSGNLYVVWEEAPLTAGVISGDISLKFSYSTNEGATWSNPVTIDTSGAPGGILHLNVFAWINAGDDGRVNIAWYGTHGPPLAGAPVSPDDCSSCRWSVWFTQSLNAHSANPTFIAPIEVSQHPIHTGTVQSLIGGQNQLSSRSLGDYLQMRTGPRGEAHIAYVDSNNISGSAAGHAMYAQQNGGTPIISTSLVHTPGLVQSNAVSDPAADGKYEAAGTSSASMPQLDILKSSVTKVTTAPCSAGAPCYKVFMQLNDLSLAPTPAQDTDPDLVWHTQWFVPSSTDGMGGKNFHVYGESLNGGALQCYFGENAVMLVGGGGIMTYPGGTTALPASNCQSTLGPNGNITIYIPLSNVAEAGAIDDRLHEVTASTMTLTQPANTNPSLGGIGGIFFNLIDVAQSYIYDPALVSVFSRKVHGAAGTFDIDLTPGSAAIECRGSGPTNDYQVVFTFASPVTVVDGATVSPRVATSPGLDGTGSISGSPIIAGNTVTVNLTNVSNAQTLSVNLFGVTLNLGLNTTTANYSVNMPVLVGDTNNDGSVNSADISQTKAQSGQVVGAGNFREDENVDGALNSADISLVKSKSGTALP